MTADDFNGLHKPGDPLYYDPAPLLGEPLQAVTLCRSAVFVEDPDFPLVSAIVKLDATGQEKTVLVEHLRARP